MQFYMPRKGNEGYEYPQISQMLSNIPKGVVSVHTHQHVKHCISSNLSQVFKYFCLSHGCEMVFHCAFNDCFYDCA